MISPSPSTRAQILQGLLNVSYAKAKHWTNTLITVQAGAYLAGVVAIFVPAISLSFPPVALVLALVHAWIAARASHHKGIPWNPPRGTTTTLRLTIPDTL